MQNTQMLNVAVSKLRPNPWNTNFVSPENEAKLEKSFDEFGMFKPIVVRELDNGQFEILGGAHRFKIAVKRGLKEVPIFSLGKISEDKAKKIGLADNARYGDDDTFKLGELLRELGSAEDILSFLPYTGDELDSIFSASDVNLDDLEGGISDSDTSVSDDLPTVFQTHRIMKFKVPIEQAEFVEKMIKHAVKAKGYSEPDALENAGMALVDLLGMAK